MASTDQVAPHPAPSRRAIIAGLLASPMVVSAGTLAADSPDAELLAAWHTRQKTMAKIEQRGSFFHAESHSPRLAAIYDKAEMAIYNLPARTPAGVLAKMWLAFSHMGVVRDEEDRVRHDVIRRANLPVVLLYKRRLDFDEGTILSAIESLTKIVEG
jgi:hypothetical protein